MDRLRKEKEEFNPNIFVPFIDIIKQFYDVKLSELDRTNMSSVHIKLLHFLVDHEGCNQQTLADIRDVRRSTISADLDRMENNGLIIRERSKLDKRMINIFLTAKGKELGEYIRSQYEEYCWSYMADFTEEEVKSFFTSMEKFTKKNKDNK